MEERKSGFKIMIRLIKILKPLVPIMFITITFGVLGYLAAILITTFSGVAISESLGFKTGIEVKTALMLVIVCAVSRGFLRYIEQYSGHYIAFKILSILRDKVYKKLRKLAPAKLESKDKGNLISIITSDIELLEVFYAHTIAPIFIAIITSLIITFILYKINIYFGIIGLVFFLIVGYFIPVLSSKYSSESGVEYRNTFGKTNSYLLDSLRGIKEVLLFNKGRDRLESIDKNSDELNKKNKIIKKHEGIIRAFTDSTIMIAIITILLVGIKLYYLDKINIGSLIVSVILLASSFGPVVALSNLSNNLIHTFACAKRLFKILDEEPEVNEVLGDSDLFIKDIKFNDVTFSYKEREEILKNINLYIKPGEKIALIGESGSGKSTLIKLIMRFFDVNKGELDINNKNIKNIKTKALRKGQSLVSQETFLFNDTILNNIKIGKKDATKEEVINAAKKASIHEFIESLEKGYETSVSELGSNFSSGERQRIGIARAFLHDADLLILDEPTSNLDTLNEASILKTLKDECKDKTLIMVSHRESSVSICDKKYKIEKSKLKIV